MRSLLLYFSSRTGTSRFHPIKTKQYYRSAYVTSSDRRRRVGGEHKNADVRQICCVVVTVAAFRHSCHNLKSALHETLGHSTWRRQKKNKTKNEGKVKEKRLATCFCFDATKSGCFPTASIYCDQMFFCNWLALGKTHHTHKHGLPRSPHSRLPLSHTPLALLGRFLEIIPGMREKSPPITFGRSQLLNRLRP